jgi:hypothetical protein
MLSFARKEGRPALCLLIHHDDAEREFAYDAGAERAFARAASDGWTVVSMQADRTSIFPATAERGRSVYRLVSHSWTR